MLERIDSFTALGIMGTGVVIGYGMREASRPVRPRRPTAGIVGLPAALDGFRILHVSDLHGRGYPADEDALARAIALDRPDVAVVTGDLLRRCNLEAGRPAVDLVCRLARLLPVYFCPGNHDYLADGSVAPMASLEAAGVTVLDNASAAGPEGTVFVGLGDPQTRRDDIDEAMRAMPPGFPIALAHSPAAFRRVITRDLPLLLCGHTHGGQGAIPGFGALWVPGGGFLPEFDRGVFYREESTMVITSGVGTSGPPFRYFVPPEFLVITLRRVEVEGERHSTDEFRPRKG
ncbi:MAG: metallophosphoesterase [Clostridia bacterium]